MLNEEQKLPANKENQELDEAIDKTVALLPLDKQQEAIAQKIIEAPSQAELQEQFNLFNMNQSKKNALRIIKLNGLLDKVEDQAIERFEKRPGEISNKELLEYMQVVSAQIDRSQQQIESLQDKPMIKATQNNTEVNINIGTDLNKDSKEKVMDAISILLKQIQKNDGKPETIDVDAEEPVQNNVYNGDVLNRESGE